MKNKMTVKDIKEADRAYDVLDNLNKKYGQPHGTNPAGIMFLVYKTMEQEALSNAFRRSGL